MANIISSFEDSQVEETHQIVEAPKVKEKKLYPIFRAAPTPTTPSTSYSSGKGVTETTSEETENYKNDGES